MKRVEKGADAPWPPVVPLDRASIRKGRVTLERGLPWRVPAKPNSAYRVLVVNDEKDIADLTAMMLERWGFRVARVYGGEDALKSAAYCRPDLIVLNVMMPVLDGFAVAQRLRADPELAGIKILLQSAGSRFGELAKRAGADGFLPTPFTSGEAFAAVARLLR